MERSDVWWVALLVVVCGCFSILLFFATFKRCFPDLFKRCCCVSHVDA